MYTNTLRSYIRTRLRIYKLDQTTNNFWSKAGSDLKWTWDGCVCVCVLVWQDDDNKTQVQKTPHKWQGDALWGYTQVNIPRKTSCKLCCFLCNFYAVLEVYSCNF